VATVTLKKSVNRLETRILKFSLGSAEKKFIFFLLPTCAVEEEAARCGMVLAKLRNLAYMRSCSPPSCSGTS
jgi:hypothetical protein